MERRGRDGSSAYSPTHLVAATRGRGTAFARARSNVVACGSLIAALKPRRGRRCPCRPVAWPRAQHAAPGPCSGLAVGVVIAHTRPTATARAGTLEHGLTDRAAAAGHQLAAAALLGVRIGWRERERER
uniref:Uncharacterized protein n=1 Tax=Setaria viridis TaxID=4556 RepID=A0A4V6D1X7_SETVI|nr:hypothetical protein SEVIR_9G427401v2 [Setaria viridis]